jgi:hypothetical protein
MMAYLMCDEPRTSTIRSLLIAASQVAALGCRKSPIRVETVPYAPQRTRSHCLRGALACTAYKLSSTGVIAFLQSPRTSHDLRKTQAFGSFSAAIYRYPALKRTTRILRIGHRNAGRRSAFWVVIDIRVVGSFGPGKSSV